MGLWYTLFYIILLAIVISFIFSVGLSNRGPWNSFWIFFLVLILGMLAMSLWVAPFGPVWYGVAWLDILIFGIIIALLISAAAAGRDRNYYRLRRGEVDIVAEAKAERGAKTLFGVFFWLFIVAMVIAIVAGILRIFEMW